MIKKSRILPAIVAAMAIFAACNSDDYQTAIDTSEDVGITAFSLTADSKVLNNLDSVFFSIDLVNAKIFNADSMPYGTDVSHIIPVITFDAASVAELTVSRAGKADTVYNYLTNPNDSIDFSQGPVRLRLVSQSGTVERNYSISVNVHRVKSDSLQWGGAALARLPGGHRSATSSSTVKYGDSYYTLLLDGGKYYMATQAHPAEACSSATEINLGGKADVNSFAATTDACYLLDEQGALYSATSPAGSWTATGEQWTGIVATYADQVIGTAVDAAGKRTLRYYPSGKSEPLPDGFPVSGCSQTVSYRFEMSTSTNVLILGGKLADGSLTNNCWSYDGNNWANLMQRTAMEPAEGMTVLPYFTVQIAADWVVTRYSTLVAFGGKLTDGSINRNVYVSYDFGVQWLMGGTLMQLPEYVPSTAFARAFVVDEEISAAKSMAFKAPARIVKPVTEWECPYIYVYGGYEQSGALSDNIWRAVINRFAFKPID